MRKPNRALWLVLLATAVLHLVFEFAQPTPELFGDEKHYLEYARNDVQSGDRSLLPGSYRFSERPEFYSRFVAQFVSGATSIRDVTTRVALAQIVLMLGLVTMIYYQARVLGQSEMASLISAGALVVFPWFAFHIHSLWPEIPHAFFFAVVVLTALLYTQTGRPILLVVSGLSGGMAMLTKGVLPALLPVLLVAFSASSLWRRRRDPLNAAAIGRALLAPVIFAASLFIVVGPQLVHNKGEVGEALLSSNRWWNLEIGLSASVDSADSDVYSEDYLWLAKDRLFEVYKGYPEREREERARERSLAYLSKSSPISIVSRQISKFVDLWISAPDLILQRQATFDQALGVRGRWGDSAPTWIAVLREFARWFWRLLLPMGLLGLVIQARRNPGGVLVLLLALTFLLATLAVPLKVRLLLPIAPLLVLGLGALFDLARGRLARGVARG